MNDPIPSAASLRDGLRTRIDELEADNQRLRNAIRATLAEYTRRWCANWTAKHLPRLIEALKTPPGAFAETFATPGQPPSAHVSPCPLAKGE